MVSIALFHQRLVASANARPGFDDSGSSCDSRARRSPPCCAVLVQLILGAAFRHKAFGIIPHLIGAVVVTGADLLARRRAASGAFPALPALRAAARGLHVLIGLQLLLGGAAWWSRVYAAQFPQPIPVMVALTVIHTVTGALVLADHGLGHAGSVTVWSRPAGSC